MKPWQTLILAGLLIASVAHAEVLPDDPPLDPGQSVGGTTTISGSDTLRTAAIQPFGATTVVFAIKATTGKDSATVVLVSQDGTKYFTPAQDFGTALVKTGYAGGDSLNNGPHTFVVSCNDGKSTIPLPYRYMKLKVYGTVGTTITGLSVIAQPVYAMGGSQEFKNVYGETW